MTNVVTMTVSALSNRLQYLHTTLDSWRRVRALKEWSFRFYVEPGPFQHSCVSMIEAWSETLVLTDVHIIRNESRQGVLRNPWLAFDDSFSTGADFVLLVEEDIIVSMDVLEYFARTSAQFAPASRVLAVCGSYFEEDGDPQETFFYQNFCPLVWGTWYDRWRDILRDTWDLDYSTGNSDGSESGWDWNIRKRILPQRDMVCVWPLASRALHIGEYGAHMQPHEFPASQARGFRADR